MAWLFRFKNSKRWWIGYRVAGKLIQRSTRTADRKEAERQLAAVSALHSSAKAGLPIDELYAALKGNPAAARVTLQAEVDSWIAECQSATSPTTADAYRTVAKSFLTFLKDDGSFLLRNVTADHIRLWFRELSATKTAATSNNRLKILRMLFARAHREGRIDTNPAAQVKGTKIKGKDRSRRPFTVEEVGTLLRKAEPFWRFAVLVSFYTGLRLGDVATMPAGAVDLKEGVIRLRARKTDTPLTLPLSGPLKALFPPLLVGKKPTDDLWPEYAARYRERGARDLSPEFHDLLVTCGLADPRTHQKTKSGRDGKRDAAGLSFHCLRHTFVSLLKASGSTQAVAKSLAGHTGDDMSDHYTTLPIATLRDAVDRLPTVS